MALLAGFELKVFSGSCFGNFMLSESNSSQNLENSGSGEKGKNILF
jgi:hypothetical protein